MEFNFFKKQNFLMKQSLIALFLIPFLSIPILYNNFKNNNRAIFDKETLIKTDSFEVYINKENILNGVLNKNKPLFAYEFDEGTNDIKKEYQVVINDYQENYKYNCYKVSFINNDFDFNNEFFLKNAFNKLVYISCDSSMKSFLESSLDSLILNVKKEGIEKRIKSFESAFDGNDKKVILFNGYKELAKNKELLHFLSPYIKSDKSYSLVNFEKYQEEFKKTFTNFDFDRMKKQQVIEVSYTQRQISFFTNVDQIVDNFKETINKK